MGQKRHDRAMSLRLVTHAERAELRHLAPAAEAVWPEYNLHGDVMNEWWGALLEELAEYQFCLVDEETGAVVAEAHTGPLAWSGDDDDLPPSIDDAVGVVVRARRDGAPVNSLCAFAAEVAPDARRGALAGELLGSMTELARRHGLRRVIAPVRPSRKERYPLTPIERYVTWRREDGELLDPWMRLHERLGARRDGRPGVAAHHGQRARLGELDRHSVPGVGRVRVPARAGAADRRPRGGCRHLLGAERLDDPPRALGDCARLRPKLYIGARTVTPRTGDDYLVKARSQIVVSRRSYRGLPPNQFPLDAAQSASRRRSSRDRQLRHPGERQFPGVPLARAAGRLVRLAALCRRSILRPGEP